ncbi:MAG: NAD+ synthase [Pseudomonadota bacterium]
MTTAFTLALAQMNPTVGDLAGNAARMVAIARDAAAQGADLVLYPEMALTGYPPEDLVLIPAFREMAMAAAQELAAATADLPCDLIFGSVWYEGTQTYNASLLAAKGALTLVRAKHDLPNYGVFDEKRVFDIGAAPTVLHWRGITLGILICEEVWDVALATMLAAQGAEMLLVQNASPYHIGKANQRKKVVDAAAHATGLPVVYLNLVGGQDELVFDGRSYARGPSGGDVARLPAFAESLGVTRWEKRAQGWECVAAPMVEVRSDEETIYRALVLGLRDYVQKNKFPGVVLGLSGGIDSGVSAAIAADALGADKVHAIRLSSPFTSLDSLEDAEQLATALGLRMDTMPITPLIDTARQTLAPLFEGRHADTTEENIQARMRGLLLMALSNKFGAMVLTTGNKSEMSVGYATLYGDMCGGFSVLKDVYKTTVFKLAQWRTTLRVEALVELGFLGAAGEVIPQRMITKPPTAELRPNQRDDDSLPPYAELDAMLRGLVERQKSVAELVGEGMDPVAVARVARMVAAAEYKRRQSAPGVKITPMAFGRDRRWPITNAWKFA